MRLRNRVTAFALLSMALPSLVIPTYAQQKPNVVFMLADNVGYGDLGPYGGGELRGARRRASTSSPMRGCGSRSTWSNQAARRRARP
jgi:hypothetical protein